MFLTQVTKRAVQKEQASSSTLRELPGINTYGSDKTFSPPGKYLMIADKTPEWHIIFYF